MGEYADRRTALAKELKRRIVAAGGQGVRVKGGRGTAYGWIDVWCSEGADGFTPEQRQAVETVTGSSAGGNCWVGRVEEVEMILEPSKRKPLCPICGTIYHEQSQADFCRQSH